MIAKTYWIKWNQATLKVEVAGNGYKYLCRLADKGE